MTAPAKLTPLAGRDPVLIGITGRAGAGKTTAAAYLQRRFDFEPVAFADALKDMLATMLADRNVDHAVLHEPDLKHAPLPECHHTTARHLMQTLGDWGREQVDPQFWVAQLQARALGAQGDTPVHDRLLVTDVRYPNEAAWLRQRGGVLLRITRCMAPRLDWHSSESWTDSLPVSAEVPNDGLLASLHTQLDKIMADLDVPERLSNRAPA